MFWPLSAIVLPGVGLLARIEIEGGQNLPVEGPYVLAPNHYSEIDPLIIAVATWKMGRAPRFMAKESLFRVPVLGWALRVTGMIPVARASTSGTARQTLDAAEALTTEGRGVIVYPEGTLTRDPELWPMRGKTGAARLALQADVPVIPLAHWGVQEIMPRYGKRISLWPPRKRVRVLVGEPVDLSAHSTADGRPASLSAATTVVMDRIAELLGILRGEQPPSRRWDPTAHQQKETGRFES